MEMKTYKKGEVIFRQGDAGNCMYDIHWGKVGIYVNYGTDKEEKLAELRTEEFFGEMGLVEHEARSATAVALVNHTSVSEITEENLHELFEKQPAKVLLIMQHLSKGLRRLTKDYMKACQTVAELSAKEEADAETKDEPNEELSERVRYFSELALRGSYKI